MAERRDCRVCNHDERDAIEALGKQALAGELSWAGAARQASVRDVSLKTHMTKHFVSEVAAETTEVYDTDVANSIRELRQAMQVAPAEVKPFYLVAIRNLEGIAQTKPSQEHLLKALKGIHEVTGMRMEQRMMLGFMEAHFANAGELEEAKETASAVLVAAVMEEN